MKKIFFLGLLILHASILKLNGYSNYIVNASENVLRLRVRYGKNIGDGVFLPVNHSNISEFFILNPNEIFEIKAENNQNWIDSFGTLKIRIADIKDDLKMDIDTQKKVPTATRKSNQEKMSAVDIDLNKNYDESSVFVLEIKPGKILNLVRANPTPYSNIPKSNPNYSNIPKEAADNVKDLSTVLPKNMKKISSKTLSYQDLIKNIIELDN